MTRPTTRRVDRSFVKGSILIWNAFSELALEQAWALTDPTPKNLFDNLTIVDRSRGALPGSQRMFQGSMSYAF